MEQNGAGPLNCRRILKICDNFANSIALVHPDENRLFCTHTDASRIAVSDILLEVNDAGGTQIVSTASSVISPAEQRYSMYGQELLAIVYALRKFMLYVYGHQIKELADNKPLYSL